MIRKFVLLCAQHKNRIYNFAYYHLGNREDAEDVTQEVLLRLWCNLGKIESENVPGWIVRVTRNACIDILRRRKSQKTVSIDEINGGRLPEEAIVKPELETESNESDLRERLELALREIREPYKSILILREVQGMKYDRIGEALDLPLNTVKVYLHRGRKMLRDRFREIMNHDQI